MRGEEGPTAGVELYMAVAPGEGIPAATASGSGRERRLRPGMARCDVFRLDDASGDWTFFESAVVFDDYPGFAVAAGHWAQILVDRRGRYRLIGEEVGEGPGKEA
jgi:hypothetical protein